MCRLGLVGYGVWGANLARNIAKLIGEPAFICDNSSARRTAAKAVFPNSLLPTDWRAAVALPVDGVVIAASSDQHFHIAWEALSAGKHVFIEKPFALSTNHAERLIELSARMGLQLMVDHTYLFSAAIRGAARLLADGAIGEPTRVTSHRLNARAIRNDAPVHWDLAVHDLAIIDFLLPGVPDSVTAASSPCGHTVDLCLHFSTGLEARISVSWVADAKRRLLEIEGTRGSLRIDDMEPNRKLRVRDAITGAESFPELEATEPLAAAIQHFIDCIEFNRTPVSCGASALRGIRLLSAADQSLLNQGLAVATGLRRAAA
jgi:predicted dehydrogenase